MTCPFGCLFFFCQQIPKGSIGSKETFKIWLLPSMFVLKMILKYDALKSPPESKFEILYVVWFLCHVSFKKNTFFDVRDFQGSPTLRVGGYEANATHKSTQLQFTGQPHVKIVRSWHIWSRVAQWCFCEESTPDCIIKYVIKKSWIYLMVVCVFFWISKKNAGILMYLSQTFPNAIWSNDQFGGIKGDWLWAPLTAGKDPVPQCTLARHHPKILVGHLSKTNIIQGDHI